MPQEQGEQSQEQSPSAVPLHPTSTPSNLPSPAFDPSRMIGIIKRKALIKELAAVYHSECLAYCQELLELQRKWDEVMSGLSPKVAEIMLFLFPYIDMTTPENSRKEAIRQPKRLKKSR